MKPSLCTYFAMTSTYPLPFLPFLIVPPFLACGAPIRSSMLLALLMPVAGLEGGADGGAEPGAAVPANPSPVVEVGCSPSSDGVSLLDTGFDAYELSAAVGAVVGGPVTLTGGVAVLGRGGTGGASVTFLVGGAPDALTALEGGPLGGGRVDPAVAGVSPPFLFTHFFNSLS